MRNEKIDRILADIRRILEHYSDGEIDRHLAMNLLGAKSDAEFNGLMQDLKIPWPPNSTITTPARRWC